MLKSENCVWTSQFVLKYYLIKILRYWLLNAVVLLMFLYILPFIGYGPVWHFFGNMISGCDKYWWTNLLWINNIYPRSYEEKCLPWTWYMATYVQLSLLVPPIVALCRNFIHFKWLFYFVGMFALLINFCFVYISNEGASIILNDSFFAKVFMNPLFHFSSFFYGSCLGLVYHTYFIDLIKQ